MGKRAFHPILFALFPVLSLYSLNTALVPITDIFAPLAIIVASVATLWTVVTLVLKDSSRAAVGVSSLTASVFAFGHVYDLIYHNERLYHLIRTREDLLNIWIPLMILVFIAGCWKRKDSTSLNMPLNIIGLVLAGFPLYSISVSWINAAIGTKIASATHSSNLKTSDRPDIYYVILDGYGRNDSLKRVIGFSNDDFIKGLKSRGFYVADDARSNYCQTELSLSSSLNLNYLSEIIPKVSTKSEDRLVLDNLIDKNEASKYLKKLGYRYVAITTGFPSVRPYSADIWMHDEVGISFFSATLLTDIPTLPNVDQVFENQFDSRRDYIRAAFNNMVSLAGSYTQPRFIFAHVLAPHPPFVFGPKGQPTKTKKMLFGYVDGSDFLENGGTVDDYKTGYANQATYINTLVLDTVDKILKKSSKPPIIIFQGDHGSKLRLNQINLEKTDVNECFPNLNAFLVPPQVQKNLYPGITPVNSFRLIFNGLFGDKFAKLPDNSFYSGWLSPYKYLDVSERIHPHDH